LLGSQKEVENTKRTNQWWCLVINLDLKKTVERTRELKG